MYYCTTKTSRQVCPCWGKDVHAHMPILYAWPARWTNLQYDQVPIRIAHQHISHFGLMVASGGAKLPKMLDSLPRTPVNHRAKFDAAGFILGGEIRNRTNTHTHTVAKTNKYVRLRGRLYIRTCRSYVHTPRGFTNGASLARRVARALTEL